MGNQKQSDESAAMVIKDHYKKMSRAKKRDFMALAISRLELSGITIHGKLNAGTWRRIEIEELKKILKEVENAD